MTIESCMQLVETMLPNRVSDEVKLRFLGEAEWKVRVELLGEDPQTLPIFDPSTPKSTELTAPHPYDQLYWQYVLAMLSYASGDIARYENAAGLFNASYQSFGKWLKRRGA